MAEHKRDRQGVMEFKGCNDDIVLIAVLLLKFGNGHEFCQFSGIWPFAEKYTCQMA
jgi:hypothetical protein